MRIGQSVQPALQALQNSNQSDTSAGVTMLKKALDSQSDAASALLKMLEPKGQVIDIRA